MNGKRRREQQNQHQGKANGHGGGGGAPSPGKGAKGEANGHGGGGGAPSPGKGAKGKRKKGKDALYTMPKDVHTAEGQAALALWKEKGKCIFYLKKKGRYCHFEACEGDVYCGNHRVVDNRPRIPCPVDPRHTIFKDELQKHLKKCQSLKRMKSLHQEPYYVEDANVGQEEEGRPDIPTKERKERIVALGGEEIRALVSKIHRSMDTLAERLRWREDHDPTAAVVEGEGEGEGGVSGEGLLRRPKECDAWFGDGEFSPANSHLAARKYKTRHIQQQVSMIGHYVDFFPRTGEAEGSRESRSVVELGAGKGHLGTMWVKSMGFSHLLLVDNQCFSLKADREISHEEGMKVERFQCDLKDFAMDKVKSLADRRVCVVGKHLCGGATDMALQICKTSRESSGVALQSLCIASCCHHKCTWRAFVAKEVFEDLGLTAQDFQLISWMTGWACCGHDHVKKDEAKDDEAAEERKRKMFGNLKMPERIKAGLACKRLLDLCRIAWLRQNGFLSTQFVKYCPRIMTGENMLLLAK
ncbi:tRNA:m(4)X modification enzyme TRM13 [Chloropicon primus]|nr:tRNA:m(4)X modification enzyme TRM13 [Chloropicon primus]